MLVKISPGSRTVKPTHSNTLHSRRIKITRIHADSTIDSSIDVFPMGSAPAVFAMHGAYRTRAPDVCGGVFGMALYYEDVIGIESP